MGRRSQTRELVRGTTTTEQKNQPAAAASQLTAAAVLCPRIYCNLATPWARAGRGAGSPSGSYCRCSRHRGNCVIHCSSVGYGYTCSGCRIRVQMFSTPRRTHTGSLLKKQNTKYRLGGSSHPADISRVRNTCHKNMAICDGDTILDRHVICLYDQYHDLSEFFITLVQHGTVQYYNTTVRSPVVYGTLVQYRTV